MTKRIEYSRMSLANASASVRGVAGCPRSGGSGIPEERGDGTRGSLPPWKNKPDPLTGREKKCRLNLAYVGGLQISYAVGNRKGRPSHCGRGGKSPKK